MLNTTETITGLTAQDIMSVNPKHIHSDSLVVDALNTMENYSITQLIVLDEGNYKGVIHLHDILKEGVV
jgi:arabinose-5-phosphate isomerase